LKNEQAPEILNCKGVGVATSSNLVLAISPAGGNMIVTKDWA